MCVGRPVAGMEVRVIRISDEPIAEWSDDLLAPPGEVGEFVVRGPVVTRQYHNRPAATELAAVRCREALDALGEIVGRIDNERMLDKLFASFCIGK